MATQRPRLIQALLLILMMWSPSKKVWAHMDLTVSGKLRTYPLSGTVDLEWGKGLVLWGNPGAGNSIKSPWYGYTRGALTLSTAGVYNGALVEWEVYPISFLGVKAGGEAYNNSRDYTAYDCEAYRCQGDFMSHFVEGRLGLGAGPLFLFAGYRQTDLSPKVEGDDYVEPFSGLVANGVRDRLIMARSALGVKFNERWAFSVMGIYLEMLENSTFSRTYTGQIHYSKSNWTVIFGGGQFESALKAPGLTINGVVKWDIIPGIGLL